MISQVCLLLRCVDTPARKISHVEGLVSPLTLSCCLRKEFAFCESKFFPLRIAAMLFGEQILSFMCSPVGQEIHMLKRQIS